MDILQKAKGYIDTFGKGVVRQMAPYIAGGIFCEYVRSKELDVAKITEEIQQNRSIWKSISIEHREKIANLLDRVGDLSFITPDFLISTIEQELPVIASLFLGWDEAMQWLKDQIDEITTHALD